MSDYLPLTFTEATTVTSGLISEEARRIYWAYGDVYAKAAGRITRTWATTIRARDVLGLDDEP